MSNSGGVISAPVSIQDIHDVLGESSYNLETLCKSYKINKWSRRKPVRWTVDFEENAPLIIRNQWESGVNGDYGINVLKATLNQMNDKSSTAWYGMFQGVPWEIRLPSGGPNYPFRIGDFRGYTSSLNWSESGMKDTPVEVVMGDAAYFYLTGTYTMSFTCAKSQSDLLGFSESIGFGNSYVNMYLGAMFQIPSTEAVADNFGYRYLVVSFSANISSGTRKTYTYGYIERISEFIFSVGINLPKNIFSNYVNKKIFVRPCATTGQCSYTDTTDGSITVYSIAPDIKHIYTKYMELLPNTSKPGYVRPTATISCSVTRVGATFTISNLKAVIKRGTGDTTAQQYQIYIKSINVEIERYESEASAWIYYTKTPGRVTLTNTTVLLNYVSGSTATWNYGSNVQAVASGTLSARALVRVGFEVRYNGDVFTGSYTSSTK